MTQVTYERRVLIESIQEELSSCLHGRCLLRRHQAYTHTRTHTHNTHMKLCTYPHPPPPPKLQTQAHKPSHVHTSTPTCKCTNTPPPPTPPSPPSPHTHLPISVGPKLAAARCVLHADRAGQTNLQKLSTGDIVLSVVVEHKHFYAKLGNLVSRTRGKAAAD